MLENLNDAYAYPDILTKTKIYGHAMSLLKNTLVVAAHTVIVECGSV